MKPTSIIITNNQQIKIERDYMRGSEGWILTERDLSKITQSSQRRLFKAVSRVEWSASESESWYESGFGYDYDQHVTFNYPCKGKDQSRWLQYIVAADMIGQAGQGK